MATVICFYMVNPIQGVPLVLLTAGSGVRMQPLTLKTPKCLLPIVGKPISVRIIELFENLGITEVIVVTSPDFQQEIRDALHVFSPSISIKIVLQQEPRGMADALAMVKKNLPVGTDSFIVSAADVIFPQAAVGEFIRFHLDQENDLTLSLMKSDDSKIAMGHGNLRVDDEYQILDIIEKPALEQIMGPFYSPPVYIFKNNIFGLVEKVSESPRGERELQDAIKLAIEEKLKIGGCLIVPEEVTTKTIGKYHITTPGDFLKMNLYQLKNWTQKPSDESVFPTILGRIWVHPEAIVDDSNLIGPEVVLEKVKIGAYSEISGSVLREEVVIGKDCRIRNSIVDVGVQLPDNTKIEGSILYLDEDKNLKQERLNNGK